MTRLGERSMIFLIPLKALTSIFSTSMSAKSNETYYGSKLSTKLVSIIYI